MQLGFNMDDSSNSKKVREQKSSTKEDVNDFSFDSDNEESETKKKGLDNSKIILFAAIAIVIVTAVVCVFLFKKQSSENPVVADNEGMEENNVNGNNSSSDNSNSSDEETYVYDEDGNPIYSSDNYVVDDSAIDPGAPDYSSSLRNETTAKVYADTDYIKDINNVDILANYKVASRDYVVDYVSYVAKRGIIDDGMEIYWLECTYHDKKYRCQVPFYYFKDFQETGICKVKMEVLNIEGGGKVISYMQVAGND